MFGDCLKLSEADRKGPRGKDCEAARDNFRVCRERIDRLTDGMREKRGEERRREEKA